MTPAGPAEVAGTPPDLAGTRAAIRAFLAADPVSREPHVDGWNRYDPGFSRRLGQAGFIGMTWPRDYGGHARPALERYVVVEEICAAGVPAAAHWSADRQIGPALLRYGSEAQRRRLLPGMVRGETYFSLGMSEPESGSDLASVRTRATRAAGGGWRLAGRKIWTSFAHDAHFALTLCRTSGSGEDRNAGLSQFIVPLDSPGLTIRPVVNMAGRHEFNEVLFDDVPLGEDALLGQEGQGWEQVTGELALERSGPERFLSSFVLLDALVRQDRAEDRLDRAALIGALVARLVPLRGLSFAIARAIDAGASVASQAALVKELGSRFEQELPDILIESLDLAADRSAETQLERLLAEAALHAPSFSIRGGTREILRGIIARDMGLR